MYLLVMALITSYTRVQTLNSSVGNASEQLLIRLGLSCFHVKTMAQTYDNMSFHSISVRYGTCNVLNKVDESGATQSHWLGSTTCNNVTLCCKAIFPSGQDWLFFFMPYLVITRFILHLVQQSICIIHAKTTTLISKVHSSYIWNGRMWIHCIHCIVWSSQEEIANPSPNQKKIFWPPKILMLTCICYSCFVAKFHHSK